ncbi:MAG: hypothetical protein US42_C0001G0049 [Candidatus Magasanikbacteria bacterium GW2011_GWC2_37_14]|uniref:Uncharacterized protein n=1 Tax=Candidatus Magasanikbacteria bacterium GW2011_GWC2_37_14 TaxID=1619046 RepID=A0A0G0GAS3_9BACT|nr:MAG: hypothetical protein US42_C0001G0049 [Candidatus Magasanikbacteria bacterium GW2011_GWC2_37_14]
MAVFVTHFCLGAPGSGRRCERWALLNSERRRRIQEGAEGSTMNFSFTSGDPRTLQKIGQLHSNLCKWHFRRKGPNVDTKGESIDQDTRGTLAIWFGVLEVHSVLHHSLHVLVVEHKSHNIMPEKNKKVKDKKMTLPYNRAILNY